MQLSLGGFLDSNLKKSPSANTLALSPSLIKKIKFPFFITSMGMHSQIPLNLKKGKAILFKSF